MIFSKRSNSLTRIDLDGYNLVFYTLVFNLVFYTLVFNARDLVWPFLAVSRLRII